MKLRNFIVSSFAALAAMVACQPEGEEVGGLNIDVDKTELSFPVAGDDQTVSLTATQDWFTEVTYSEGAKDWIVVDPETGAASAKAQTVTISALPNTGGYDRTAQVKFSIGMRSKYVEVTQTGDKGSTDALVVYSNDFDKEISTQVYGDSGDKWPYLDQFPDGWKNQTGTGVANVDYAFASMSCRNNSNSDGKYSAYSGSGKNNLLFGNANYFAVKNIALGSEINYTLSFGTTKYAGEGDNTYKPSEFHVYVSADASKWVELTYAFPNGYQDGKWDVASSSFTLPEGTSTLHLYFKSDLGGAHRIDDLKLVVSESAGTTIDFAAGEEFEVGGSSSGGQVTPPSEITDVTVAEFNDKEVSTSVWYRLTGVVGGPINTTYGNFDLTDETGKVYVYGISNWSDYQSKVKLGGTVTVVGTRGDFNGKIEVLNGYIEAYDASTETGGDDPSSGEPGEYDPQGITWTLGTNAYDNTSGTNAQYGVVNGVNVANLLKIGTGSKTGDATLHVPAGTEKIGFYALAWNGKTARVKFSINGTELTTITPAANTGAASNPPYTITVADSDYFVIEMPSTEATDVKVETLDASNGRALFIKLEANPGTDTPPSGGEDPETPPTGGETPEPGAITTIAEVLALGANTTIPAGTTIEGVVISNMDLNNLTSKKGMYVQDETASLQFYLAENHSYAFGDKVQIDLGGSTVGAYNGAVQISGLALSKINKVSSGNTVTPKTVSVADFLANKYEGQYVAIEGVQVAAADLTKTFVMSGAHTSINIETADGKKFVVFSSKYATYGTQTVPQGSGTIKGISSINNGALQIIFAQESDYAGLTGERFSAGSGEVTPPEGGDQGGDTPDPSGPVVATVAQFLAAAEDETIYQLTGVITSVANTEFGNFYLQDDTGNVYIYGLCSPTGETKYWAASGAKVGDTITVQTVRTSYNGTPQGKNAIFVSLVPGEPAPEPEIPEGATVASVTFSALGYANEYVVDGNEIAVDDNISLLFKKETSTTAPAYYENGYAIRMYQGGATLDVKAANDKKIVSIELTFANNHYYLAADSGSLTAEAPVRTWTGEAANIKFTSTGTDKNHRAYVSAIKVIYK